MSDPEKLNEAVSLNDAIIVSLRRISQAVESYSRFLWQEYGLTSPQLGALRALQQHGGIGPSQLAERLHLSAQTIAGIVNRLEQRQLVVRKRSAHDRRAVELEVTAEGRRLADSAPSLLSDRFRNELQRLEDWERTQILATLQRVAGMMHAAEVSSAPFFYHEPVESDRPQ